MFQNLTTKGMLIDIASVIHSVTCLTNKNKDYNTLLSYVKEKNFYWDEDTRYPVIKDLVVQLGFTPYQFHKTVKSIYNELFRKEEEILELNFNEGIYEFELTHFDNYFRFRCKKLPVLPNLGDSIDVPFFDAIMGRTNYYVDSIRHYFEPNIQITVIRLKSGEFNKYWHIRKDEPKLKGELFWKDFYELKDSEIKEKLGFRDW